MNSLLRGRHGIHILIKQSIDVGSFRKSKGGLHLCGWQNELLGSVVCIRYNQSWRWSFYSTWNEEFLESQHIHRSILQKYFVSKSHRKLAAEHSCLLSSLLSGPTRIGGIHATGHEPLWKTPSLDFPALEC